MLSDREFFVVCHVLDEPNETVVDTLGRRGLRENQSAHVYDIYNVYEANRVAP